MDENTQTLAIAVDGSDTALQAVRQGIALVQGGLNAQLALLHVQEPATFLELATNDSDLIAGAALEAGKDLLASAEALAQAAGVPFTSEIALGEPATELLDLAESFIASMLIIGARGVGALQRALMGSVSQAVLNRANLPVLIVKPVEKEEAESADQ